MKSIENDSLLGIENLLACSYLTGKIEDNYHLLSLRRMTPDEEIERLEKQREEYIFQREEIEKAIAIRIKYRTG